MSKMRKNRALIGSYEANLGGHMNYSKYMISYHNAFNALMENVSFTGFHVDRISIPILFIARHYLEIGLKSNIVYFSHYSKLKCENLRNHSLVELFEEFQTKVGRAIEVMKDNEIEVDASTKAAFDDYYNDVRPLIDFFNSRDPRSFTFRYPDNDKGNKGFIEPEKVDMLWIQEQFEKASTLLAFTKAVFADYTDYADWIDNYFKSEMDNIMGNL